MDHPRCWGKFVINTGLFEKRIVGIIELSAIFPSSCMWNETIGLGVLIEGINVVFNRFCIHFRPAPALGMSHKLSEGGFVCSQMPHLNFCLPLGHLGDERSKLVLCHAVDDCLHFDPGCFDVGLVILGHGGQVFDTICSGAINCLLLLCSNPLQCGRDIPRLNYMNVEEHGDEEEEYHQYGGLLQHV